jgi:hypothetical protein
MRSRCDLFAHCCHISARARQGFPVGGLRPALTGPRRHAEKNRPTAVEHYSPRTATTDLRCSLRVLCYRARTRKPSPFPACTTIINAGRYNCVDEELERRRRYVGRKTRRNARVES